MPTKPFPSQTTDGSVAPSGARGSGGPLVGTLGVVVLALMAVGLAVGPVPLTGADVLGALGGDETAAGTIVREIRLPRVVLAALVGAVLGAAGAALQGLLRNPLAEPGVIGTSGFAALGAVIPLYFGLVDRFALASPLGGLIGALIGIVLLLVLAGRGASVVTVVLAGAALSSLAGAGVALALNLAPNPFAALEIAFWLLGSLEDRSIVHVQLVAAPILIALAILLASGRGLSALSLGEDVAATLRVKVDRLRLTVVTAVALGVGSAVAVTGVIGFIGLIVPHILRPFVGHRPDTLLLPSALGGAVVLLAADLVVKLLPTAAELKVGVVTALVGAPFFLFLLRRGRTGLT